MVLTFCEKMFLVIEKKFEIWGWRPRIRKSSVINRTIYSNSERSDLYSEKNAFLIYSWRFLRSDTLEQLEFKLEKIIGI